MAYRRSQLSGTGGELSDDMDARVDIEEFGIGLRTAYNVIIHKTGGMSGVAGTEHVCTVPDSAYSHRLTPFEFNTEQAYVNVWGNLRMCVIKDGALVLENSQNVVSITQAAQGVVEITGHTWSDGDLIYSTGIGGMSALNARYFIADVTDADHFKLKDLYGNYIDTSALPSFTAGGVFARVHQVVSPYSSNADPNNTLAQVFYMDFAQTNDEGYFAHLEIAPQKLTRSAHNNWTLAAQVRAATIGAPTITVAAAAGTGLITYRYVATAINDITGEESLASVSDDCTNDLSADPTYKNTITISAPISGASRYNFYKEENGVYGFIGGTTGLVFIDGPGGSAGGEITPDLSVTPPLNYDPFPGALSYPAAVEFHEARLVFGQTFTNPGVLWASQPTRWANFNRSVPQRSDDVVIGRLLPGVNAIQGMCSLGDVLFCATSGGEFTISGSGVVNYLTPASAMPHVWDRVGADRLKPLLVGGYSLFVQKQGKSVYAFGPNPENPSRYIAMDLTVLAGHLLEDHFIVDWCHQRDPHGIVWMVRDDGVLLTLTFLPQFKIFAFTRVGLARSAAGAAVVESCACVPGPNEDEVYFAVKRTINGVTRRHVERLKSLSWGTSIANYWGLHAALLYNGAPANDFDNCWHLEGETNVAALADGHLVTGLTCTNGRVTLSPTLFPDGASKVLIGLQPDHPVIVPMPAAQPTSGGAAQGRRKRVIGAVLKLKRSAGVWSGPNATSLKELRLRPNSTPIGTPTPPFTGDHYIQFNGKAAKDGTFMIRGTGGLPLRVQGIFPDVAVSNAKTKLADADA